MPIQSFERGFIELFIDRWIAESPTLVMLNGWRRRKLEVKLAIDCFESAGGKVGRVKDPVKREKRFRMRTLQLMQTQRFRSEKDRILARRGLTPERIAATIMELMEGSGVSKETLTYDGEGVLTERKVEKDANLRMRAADMAIRFSTGYAATNSRVQLSTTPTYDALDLDNVPEIYVDPSVALEAKTTVPSEDESYGEDEDEDEDDDDTEEPDDAC